MVFEKLKSINPGLNIRGADDPAFTRYGRVLDATPYHALMELADRLVSLNSEANQYVASVPALEADSSNGRLRLMYGCTDIQVGYCCGPNSLLDAMEWHESPEINMAATDMVLFLGRRSDIAPDGTYASDKAECFYLPKGTAVELMPETLHYSPCKVYASGFKCVVVLPRETNQEFGRAEKDAIRDGIRLPDAAPGQENMKLRMLMMRDKWLIAHAEAKALVRDGAFVGVVGKNYRLNFLAD